MLTSFDYFVASTIVNSLSFSAKPYLHCGKSGFRCFVCARLTSQYFVLFRFMFKCSVAFILISSRVYNVYVFIYLAFWCYLHETVCFLSVFRSSFCIILIFLCIITWYSAVVHVASAQPFSFLNPFCTVFVKKPTDKRILYC